MGQNNRLAPAKAESNPCLVCLTGSKMSQKAQLEITSKYYDTLRVKMTASEKKVCGVRNK